MGKTEIDDSGRSLFEHLSSADLRGLLVFQTIAEGGGFAAAENALDVSRSTLSIQLSRIEARLGYRLCERGRGGFRLTQRGRVLLEACARLHSAVEEFQQTATEMSDRIVGRLRVGFMDHTATDERFSTARLIQHFLASAPDVELEIVQDIQSRLRDLIISKQLDLAIGAFATPAPMTDTEPLYVERQHVYCGPLHPLFGGHESDVNETDLENADWVRRSYSLAPRNGFPLRMRPGNLTASNLEAVAVLIQASPVLGYLPDHFARSWVTRGRLRRLTDRFFTELDITLLSRSGRRDTAAMRKFRSLAHGLARNL